jgi:acyl CoA:acetate/3-ketoacid CoA transferase beta subunit
MTLTEISPDTTLEEVQERTGCKFAVSDPLPFME